MTIRPIRPEDCRRPHRVLLAAVAAGHPLSFLQRDAGTVAAEQTVRLTQIDYDREMALIAN